MSTWFFSHSKHLLSPLEQPTHGSPTHSLLYYETGSPPPSARVDPKLKLQPRRPLRPWDYLKFGAIVAAKATEVTTDVLSHHIWGPRRKSWGIEMTIVTSLIRGAERHSALVDIGTIRTLMGIGGLVPLPSDALVSPVTFRVKKRNLRGILAEFDVRETGNRELSGEWVVGRKTWQRMQTEWKAASKSDPSLNQSPTADAAAPTESLKRKERVILYIHGGAYYLSSAAAQRIISIPLAKYTDSRVFALDYRLAPETCFPGPLHDAVSAYLRLVEELHIPPENIIVCGDSAGGGLSLALLMYLRDNGYSLPSGAILMSPWVDLTMSCESWDSNAQYDVVPFPTADNHMNPIALYLGEHTERYLTHPYASPLFGDFRGLPPLLVQAGDAEVLRDEIALLAHKATLAGVQVSHELYEDAIHVFQAFPFLEASRRSFESMRNFVRYVLPQHQSRSPQLLGAIAERVMEQEIETDRSVVVGGDGVEASIAPHKIQEFRKGSKASKHDSGRKAHSRINAGDKTADSESDEGPSWIRSPVWPPKQDFPHPEKALEDNGKGDFEHIEDVRFEEIPHLCLSSPPPHSPMGQHASIPPLATRPALSSYSSTSSTKSLSSSEVPKSPSSISPPQMATPRRIQSTSSLSVFAFDFQHSHSEKHSYNAAHLQVSGRDSTPNSPRHHPFNLFTSASTSPSPPRSSKHYKSSAKTSAHLTIPSASPTLMLPSPSVRKRRMSSGLAMVGKQQQAAKRLSGLDIEKLIAEYGASSSDPGYVVGDVETLVDEWTRLGPANKTVMVSAISGASPSR